jgi:hypothetical protein
MSLWDKIVSGFNTAENAVGKVAGGVEFGLGALATGAAAQEASNPYASAVNPEQSKYYSAPERFTPEAIQTAGVATNTSLTEALQLPLQQVQHAITTGMLAVDYATGGKQLTSAGKSLGDAWNVSNMLSPGQESVAGFNRLFGGKGADSPREQVNRAIAAEHKLQFIDGNGITKSGFKDNYWASLVAGSIDAATYFADPLILGAKGLSVLKNMEYGRAITSSRIPKYAEEVSKVASQDPTRYQTGLGAQIKTIVGPVEDGSQGISRAAISHLPIVKEAINSSDFGDSIHLALKVGSTDAVAATPEVLIAHTIGAQIGSLESQRWLESNAQIVVDHLNMKVNPINPAPPMTEELRAQYELADKFYSKTLGDSQGLKTGLNMGLVGSDLGSKNPGRAIAEVNKAVRQGNRDLAGSNPNWHIEKFQIAPGARIMAIAHWVGQTQPANLLRFKGYEIGDAAKEVQSLLYEVKGWSPETRDVWMNKWSSAITEADKLNFAQDLDQARVTQTFIDLGASREDAIKGATTLINKRNNELAKFKETGYYVDENGKDLIHDAALTTHLKDSHPLIDIGHLYKTMKYDPSGFEELPWIKKAEQPIRRGTFMTIDAINWGIDNFWKPSVLLRGGFAPRNIADSGGRLAALNILGPMIRDYGIDGVKNWAINRSHGVNSIVKDAWAGAEKSLGIETGPGAVAAAQAKRRVQNPARVGQGSYQVVRNRKGQIVLKQVDDPNALTNLGRPKTHDIVNENVLAPTENNIQISKSLKDAKTGVPFTFSGFRGEGKNYKNKRPSTMGGARYVADDPTYASQFGDVTDNHIIHIENPYVVNGPEEWIALTNSANVYPKMSFAESPIFKKYLQDQGYDGIVVRGIDSSGRVDSALKDVFGGNQAISWAEKSISKGKGISTNSTILEKTQSVATDVSMPAAFGRGSGDFANAVSSEQTTRRAVFPGDTQGVDGGWIRLDPPLKEDFLSQVQKGEITQRRADREYRAALDTFWDSYSRVIKQIVGDPVTAKLISGVDRADVYQWYKSDNRNAIATRRRMGLDSSSLPEHTTNSFLEKERFVTQYINILPESAINKIASGELFLPKEYEAMIGDASFVGPLHSQQIHSAFGDLTFLGNMMRSYRSLINKGFKRVGSDPENIIIRNPYAEISFKNRLQEIQRSMEQGGWDMSTLTQSQVDDLIRTARMGAVKDVKKNIYTLDRYSNGADSLRFTLPFVAATNNTARTWGSIIGKNPQALLWINHFFQSPEKAGIVVNLDTGKVEGDNPNVLTLVPNSKYGLVIPGSAKVLKALGLDPRFVLAPPITSFNVALGGSSVLVPASGPVVTILMGLLANAKPTNFLVKEFSKYISPSQTDRGLIPNSSQIQANPFKALEPTWVRNATTLLFEKDGTTYQYQLALMLAHTIQEKQKALGSQAATYTLTEQDYKEAEKKTDRLFVIKTLGSGFLPFSTNIIDPQQQFLIQTFKDYQKQGAIVRVNTDQQSPNFGKLESIDPTRRFVDEFGSILGSDQVAAAYTFSLNKNNAQINPTTYAYDKLNYYGKDLIGQVALKDPSLIGLLVNDPSGKVNFDSGVYNWEFANKIPQEKSNATYREHLAAIGSIQQTQVNEGWREYIVQRQKIDAFLSEHGASSISQWGKKNGVNELQKSWTDYKDGLAQRYPDWANAFKERTGKNYESAAGAIQVMLDNPKVQKESGNPGAPIPVNELNQYLQLRKSLTSQLPFDFQPGILDTKKAYQGAADKYNLNVQQLINANPRFGEIFYRYFDGEFTRLDQSGTAVN